MKSFKTIMNEGVLDLGSNPDAVDDKIKAAALFNMLKTLQLYNCGKYNDPGDNCIGNTTPSSRRRTRHGLQKDMFGHKLAIGDLVFVRQDIPDSSLDYCYGIIIGKKTDDIGRECFVVACGIIGAMRGEGPGGKWKAMSMSDMNKMRDNLELTSDSVYKYSSFLTIPGWNLIHIASKNKVATALNKLK